MAEDMTYKEIVRMIGNACNDEFYSGVKDLKATIIESATQIYIAQMNTRTQKEG